MNEFTNLRPRLPGILRTFAVGLPAGLLFDCLDLPIPWMIGPMIAVAMINLLGVHMHSPPYARQAGQVILGSAVSLYFTPTVVAALASNLGAIAAATVSAFVVGGLGALTLSRASGVEGKSTFFASIPGGAMAMAVLAERYGAEIAPVAVAHSLRVSIVVVAIPFALTYGGIPLEAAPYRPEVPLDVSVLVLWLAVGFVLGEISERLRLQNGCLLTPIFFGAALTVSGVGLSAVPHWMSNLAQLLFGLVLGALLAWIFHLPVATMIISTAPGGLANMTITAQALHISVPLVVAFHLFRVVMVNMGTQYIYTCAAWLMGRSEVRKKTSGSMS